MTEPEAPREIAAIDIGSNSFHMVVARVVGQSLQIISRHKQRVHLASGLDAQQNLDQAAIQRGLNCLAMFAERLQGFPPENVRIAATYTLRQARNAHVFLKRAEALIPYSIEIIPGTEEARLIYLGVAHTQPDNGRKLVVDIGGGSTELVIGEGFHPLIAYSKHMGCVSYNKLFFPKGKISSKRMAAAQLAAQQKMESIANTYMRAGWQTAIGSSGTIKAIREVLIGMGHQDGVITPERLALLIEAMLKVKQADELDLPGLTDDRKPVFAAGVAILSAVFKSLDIEEMIFSDGALREGLLYEMEDRFRFSDIRVRTATAMAEQYNVDLAQATRVKETAEMLYSQIEPQPGLTKTDLATLLGWGAQLHEVGLSISYPGFHRHSAYLLRHSTMPGFNLEQQTVLATLVRYQRKSLKLEEMPELSIYKRKHLYPLIRTLRLAVALNGQRSDSPLPPITVEANKEEWRLILPEGWEADNRLLAADLRQEQEYWQKAGWQLHLCESPLLIA
ncbi:exopolyphosphatase [Photobacterium ganghwense]|uniref:Exopolyphosphatase n=1 Tax=Photobacterium ganghwense TaxID=320778 RepID=A0A0J1H7M6_9GAMM|nr:exopolyphosphatase [Photobacterium ganghwense]KLV07700.1 exopolyphosphatase [Photobacterium ganghwense]PSU11447.1 exopolyphosphatase [Photobacterium ganghwense]QSV13554.1 exopolyphosphatase [Photobacterium ganghwense]